MRRQCRTSARYAEADAFYCFVELLGEFRWGVGSLGLRSVLLLLLRVFHRSKHQHCSPHPSSTPPTLPPKPQPQPPKQPPTQRDHFCQQLDNSTSGIRATIGRLMALLKAVDPQLAEHLEKNKVSRGGGGLLWVDGLGSFHMHPHATPHPPPPPQPPNQVNPQFFAFRWITLLLTQEFPFPDAVRIWDTLLADPRGRMDCLLRICLALLIGVRARLLAGDFAANVKLLQRYPSVDVSVVLREAAQLPDTDDLVGPAGSTPPLPL